MKKFKKLIPALCMLLVSAVMLGSTTFAWFSMNTTVTATGMTVNATSDELFLTIQYGSTFDKTSVATSATSTATAKSLLPVAHGTVDAGTGTATAITAAADMTDHTKWYYAYSDSNTTATAKANSAAQVASVAALGNYIASETFSVGVNDKSGAKKFANLKVTSVTIPENKGLVLVLVCGTKVVTFSATSASITENNALTDADGLESTTITAYYYINGNDKNVFSNNATQITGQISFTLSATAAAA